MRGFRLPRSVRPITDRSADRILVIRMHAIGDVAITLPSCVSLRRLLHATIDFLTTVEIAPLPAALTIFDEVIPFPFSRTPFDRVQNVAAAIPRLLKKKYSTIIDLQANWVSKTIRWFVLPDAWGEFDRWSPKSAALRVQQVFHEMGLSELGHTHELELTDHLKQTALELLTRNGYASDTRLIVLNPAGAWVSRNWPIDYFIALGKLFLQSGACKFLLLGTDRIRKKAENIQASLGDTVINLTGSTSLPEAMALLQYVSLIVSEDSGLMHMAWASGIPTIAMFGSTRHDWSSPVGPHVRVFHSGDLSCGDCMDPVCRFGDVHCLTRISPQMVFDAALQLPRLEKLK